jgi:hypothetical protein
LKLFHPNLHFTDEKTGTDWVIVFYFKRLGSYQHIP